VLTGWVGKPITGLVRTVREFKRAQNAAGAWVNTTETRDFGEVIHFVDAVTGQTRSEKLTGKDAAVKPEFVKKFNSDYVLDKTKGKGKPSGSTPAADAPPADTPFGAK